MPATEPGQPAAPRRLTLSGWPLLAAKLREGGLDWLAKRILEEWQMPRTGPGQAAYRAMRAIGRRAGQRRRQPRSQPDGDVLFAFYDLGVAPITYDFLWFLVGAELERERRGQASVHVVIVPGRRGGLRQENPELERSLDPVARRARIAAMLVPACVLLPSLSGITVASSREHAAELVERADAVFPARYEPALPRYPGPQEPLRAAREDRARVGVLRAAAADLRAVEAWLAAHGCNRPVVTVTLRGYPYVPARNSNLAAWAAFAKSRHGAAYSVVIVPDTEQCFTGVPEDFAGLPIFYEAAVAVGLRMALYQSAYLNMGVNNGPMGLCWLNERTRYITFKILNDSAPHTRAEYMEFLGFEAGRSLPFATEWQRWVWDEDDLPVIETAFEEMTARLDRAGLPG